MADFWEPAGAPSVRHEGPRPSPAARPVDLNWASVSSYLSDSMPRSPAMRARSVGNSGIPSHESHKQEAHYAYHMFGAQPDIDFTFKRNSGAYCPGREQSPSNEGAGSRSAFSDQCEALRAFRSLGVSPYIEFADRRKQGSCSPSRDAHDLEPSKVHKNQYRQHCERYKLSDITGVHKLGIGECSPRRDSNITNEPSTPSNFISEEARLAAEPLGKKKVAFSSRPSSPRSLRPRSLSPGRRPKAGSSCSDEPEVPSWAMTTISSSAKHIQDLARLPFSEAFFRVQEKYLRKTFSDVASVENEKSVASSAEKSTSTSKCAHSCRLGSWSQPSKSVSSASTWSSQYPGSQKSYRLPGNILSELKVPSSPTATPRPVELTARSSEKDLRQASPPPARRHTSPSRRTSRALEPYKGPKLAGHIIEEAKAFKRSSEGN